MPFTLTYSDQAEGWPSYYSYYPDWMIGMNNYFYTWKGGDLYRHNDSASDRNTFYLQWWNKHTPPNPAAAFSPSTLTSVFNPSPLENVLFKTIDLQGDDPWDVQLETDIQNSGFIDSAWFEKKEATYFAFVRNTSSGEFSLRSLTGVGITSNAVIVNAAVTTMTINTQVDSIISIGDAIYWADSSVLPLPLTPIYAGILMDVTRTPSQTTLTVDTITCLPSGICPTPIVSPIFYVLYVKNSIAESHGVLGHYCTFVMQNDKKSKIELFAVDADVMKSYP
jgi:hypothetical protein